MTNPVFEANLRALEARPEAPFRRLAEALGQLGPEPSPLLSNRLGAPWPSVVQNGKRVAISSVFDASNEALRWADGLEAGSALVLWGGAGLAAWSAALGVDLSVIFAVEPRLDVWRSMLSWQDHGEVIASPRWYALWGPPEDCVAWIAGRYHPLWDGGVRTRDWRATTVDRNLWDGYRGALERALSGWIGDFSTQSRFGARWYRNTWRNLPGLAAPALELTATRGAIVTGAGPSLEPLLDAPVSQRLLAGRPHNGWVVLATDTSLPALLARGIRPDLVLCLDGQQPSALHFHAPVPQGLPLLADLASLPLLHRLGMSVFPFLSGNPLGSVIERFYTGLPHLDVSSGNVSGLGVAVARALGAPEIHLWGVDYSYEVGKSYARGTYPYPLNAARANRLNPAETGLSSGCYGAVGLTRLGAGQPERYTTPRLREYRTRMFADAANLPGRLVVPPGSGWPEVEASQRPAGPRFAWKAVKGDYDALREDWRRRLVQLPRPRRGESVPALMTRLAPDVREDWLALWPLGLALLRLEGDGDGFVDRLVDVALGVIQD